MLTEKIKTQIVLHYALLLTFCLIIMFAPMGNLVLNFGIRHFENSRFDPLVHDNNVFRSELSFGVLWKIGICITVLMEGVLLFINKKFTFVIGIILALFRQIMPVIWIILDALAMIVGDDTLIVDLTVFPYFLLLLGILSIASNTSIRKQMKSLQSVRYEQYLFEKQEGNEQ